MQRIRKKKGKKKNIVPGCKIHVDKHRWCRIVNQTPIHSGNSVFECGNTGSIKQYGTLKVVEVCRKKGVLVHYTTPGNRIPFGAPLPTGALIRFEKASQLQEMDMRYKNYRDYL
ncbi:MAG: hypothetical protein WCF94_04530 [bacterium]